MPRALNKLSPRRVATEKQKGRYADGGGLYLQVGEGGARSWLFRYTIPGGKARQMGLGSLDSVSLAMARDLARECRESVARGIDPIDQRQEERRAKQRATALSKTFKWCAGEYMKTKGKAWTNSKHAKQWVSTLETYAYPVLGTMPVDTIETPDVLQVVQPIWATKSETADRVRSRIEAILNWAATKGYRSGENPARWKGHLQNILPRKSKVAPKRHHPALRPIEAPSFIADLRGQEGTAARALEFTILTAARTGETIGALWPEIDAEGKVWTVPAERMKAGIEHRVPLSARCVEILEAMAAIRRSDFVFPGFRDKRPLSNMAMIKVLERMGRRGEITVHGFRSTFRDWSAESTNYPSELCEMALAHSVGNETTGAYFRTRMFEKRRGLMDAWSAFLVEASDDKVVSLTG